MGRPLHTTTPNFWRLLRLYPPIVVRLNARVPTAGTQRRWPAHAEVAITAGLTFDRVREISEMATWDDVTISEAERYCAACRFDPTCAKDRQRVYHYLRLCQKRPSNQPAPYLRSSPQWQTEILPLIFRLRTSTPPSTGSARSQSSAQPSAA